MYHYHAFGLNIKSDLPIIEFQKSTSLHTDLHIHSGNFDQALPENSNQLLLTIGKDLKFLVESGNGITYSYPIDADQDILRLFLLGSAFGSLLQQRGYIVLHGNALTYDSKECTVIVGKQGAGKSTTAAWHYQQGAKILADDICAITFNTDGMPYVIPSYPQLKLWQASADLLQIPTHDLRRIRKNIAKFALPITDQFCTKPLPVSKIIEIDSDYESEKRLYGTDKVTLLQKHTYRLNFILRMGLFANYTNLLIRLASKVEILKNSRPLLSTNQALAANAL